MVVIKAAGQVRLLVHVRRQGGRVCCGRGGGVVVRNRVAVGCVTCSRRILFPFLFLSMYFLRISFHTFIQYKERDKS